MEAYTFFEGWGVREDVCRVLANLCYPLGARFPAPVPERVVALVMKGLLRDTSYRIMKLVVARSEERAGVEARISALVAIMKSSCNVEVVSNQRGVFALLNILRHYDTSVSVCEQACIALTYLARNEKNRVAINKARGIQVVLGVFEKHPGDMRVQTCALDVLASVLAGFPNHQTNFRTHHGLVTLRAALASGLDPKSKRVAQDILRLCA
jgi:hypothetical protein